MSPARRRTKERARVGAPGWGWSLGSLLAGVAAALAHPPYGLSPGLLGYAVILAALDRVDPARPWRSAFWRGWLAGLGYFGVGVWWVAEAFYVDAETFGWMAPLAIPILAGGLALFWGLAALLYRATRAKGAVRPLIFAGCLALLEWLRGHVFTGFPWNLPGEAWAAGSAPSQMASVVGSYGLSWITLVIASAPAVLGDRPLRRPQLAMVVSAALGLAALYGFGIARLSTPVDLSTLTVRVVQPDNPEESKYDAAKFAANVERYLSLTRQPTASGHAPEIVVWSEGAIPAPIDEILGAEAWTSGAIANALQPGQSLVMGAIRTSGPADRPLFYNSLFVLRRDAQGLSLVSTYDKHRLTPFGEFMPFGAALEKIGLRKLVPLGDFATGPEPAAIAPAGLAAFQPLICYESLFPGFTRAGARRTGIKPQWIANISNDSWFGRTAGPWQHLNLAAYRAIEEGLPMVRATPTGVSAIIDPYGRRLPKAELTLGQRGVIDAPLPRAIRSNTLYYRYGDYLFWVMLLASLSLAVRQNVRITKKS